MSLRPDAPADFSLAEVDHLMYGVSDLDRGMEHVERLSGIRPVIGGQHPGRGTRNALLSLGPRQYLEIIAPDPAQGGAPEARAVLLRGLPGPRLLTWIAATRDIAAVEKGLVAAGFRSGGIAAGSRKRPDGKVLQWRSMACLDQGEDVVPFFIEWGKDSTHPASDSPRGCELIGLRLAHPDPERVSRVLEAMGLGIRAGHGSEPRLLALIRTPRGVIELT
ncbi:MAG: VOC family protein [Acidobacteria bacterium]|nr:VOC family protein [Acidobacteriota bacterium]